MRFPIYIADGKSHCSLSEYQINAIKLVTEKIRTGEYKLVANNCLCLNENSALDILLSEKDRYGLPIPSFICSKCGIVRSGLVFDKTSNSDFYKNEYRRIYVGAEVPPENFFKNQMERGYALFTLWKQILPDIKLSSVFEIGCGAGGVLKVFFDAGIKCSGNDFDVRYLDYGKARGLNLYCGDYSNIIEDNSVDLILLSHVMEHFLDPVSELLKITGKIRPGGYLLVEVPGIYYIDKTYFNPILYLQNAHVFNYYYDYLDLFFKQLGLEVITGNERCIFILRKPLHWQQPSITAIYAPSLSDSSTKIAKYIYHTHIQYRLKLNPHLWRAVMIGFLDTICFNKNAKQF